VVLIDLVNTSWTDQQYARKALLKFFQQIQPQDRVAIFALLLMIAIKIVIARIFMTA